MGRPEAEDNMVYPEAEDNMTCPEAEDNMACPEAESLQGQRLREITAQSRQGEHCEIKSCAMETYTRRSIDKRRYI